jgi:Zn ribbon nucleic-acid-binding protein
MVTLEQTLRQTHDWAVDRIHYWSEHDIDNAYCIQCEYSEWLNPDIDNHDIFSMQYTGETR